MMDESEQPDNPAALAHYERRVRSRIEKKGRGSILDAAVGMVGG